MNSYELDQPLDLRLKALNLSRSLNHHHVSYSEQSFGGGGGGGGGGGLHAMQTSVNAPFVNHEMGAHHQMANMATSCYLQNQAPVYLGHYHQNLHQQTTTAVGNIKQASMNGCASILNPPYIGRHLNAHPLPPPPPVSFHQQQHLQHQASPSDVTQQQQLQQQSSKMPQQPDLRPQSGGQPMDGEAPARPASPSSPAHTNCSDESASSPQQAPPTGPHSHSPPPQQQARLSSVHRQPLNHHQPHPLSRLHLPPPQAQTAPQPPPPPQLSCTPTNGESLMMSRSLGSQHAAAAAAAAAVVASRRDHYNQLHHRQGSPSPPHGSPIYHHQLPVRSHSMSAQIGATMSPGCLSSFLLSHQPQAQIQQQQQQQQQQPQQQHLTKARQRPQQQHDHCQIQTLMSPVGQTCVSDQQFSSTSNSSSCSSSLSSGSLSSLASPANLACQANNSNGPNQFGASMQIQSKSSTGNNNPVHNSDSTVTMPRQHSLVSRYNCKPCGIVFSQPETLKAHQEGYCTKRDRSLVSSSSSSSTTNAAPANTSKAQIRSQPAISLENQSISVNK